MLETIDSCSPLAFGVALIWFWIFMGPVLCLMRARELRDDVSSLRGGSLQRCSNGEEEDKDYEYNEDDEEENEYDSEELFET